MLGLSMLTNDPTMRMSGDIPTTEFFRWVKNTDGSLGMTVKGIGEVAAKAILNGDDSLEDVYQDLGRIADLPIRGAKRISRLLSENEKEAYKMRMLATIVVDVELDIDIEKSLCEGVLQRIESSLERT